MARNACRSMSSAFWPTSRRSLLGQLTAGCLADDWNLFSTKLAVESGTRVPFFAAAYQ